MRTFLESRASVTMRNAERHMPSSGISVTLNAAVAGDLLKRENRRSVVMVRAGTPYAPRALLPLHSRRIVGFVVRFRRKALPGADRPHDLGLQIRRDGFETAVLRRPERAALRRGPDGGREPEHLRDRRLRVDHRDLAFLVDVLDHPASALDLPEGRPHEILGHVDEDLLDRLEQGPNALDHRAVDRRSRRGDHLAGPRWTESSWSFASTRRTLSPIAFSAARGPRFIASMYASLISSIVSCRYWIPFVASTSMFVSWIQTTLLDSLRSMPSSSSFFAGTFESLIRWPAAISPARIASTTLGSSGSTSM